MTIYSVENTADIGKPVECILDAHGQVIRGPNVWCDTETGEVIQYRTNDDGKLVLSRDRSCIVRRRMIFAAPLRVVFAYVICRFS